MVTLFDPLPVKFYVGLHHPNDSRHFACAFVSVNTIRRRKGPFVAHDWIMDSGAFTELSRHGYYRTSPQDYAAEIRRWARVGNLELAVAQDYMCERWICAKVIHPHARDPVIDEVTWSRQIVNHQRWTIERYDALIAENLPVPIMPVLQGYTPDDYVRHVRMYGDRFKYGMRVGVGSVCKRNGSPAQVLAVLAAIKAIRPDLRLHGFGIKATSLGWKSIRDLLFSADSMSWSFSARKKGRGRDANDWREAKRFEIDILTRINPLLISFR